MTFAESLQRALDHRDAGADGPLLDALLEAWRLVPDHALAALIEDVSLRYERAATRKHDPFLEHVKRNVWLEQLARRDVREVGWLVGMLASAAWATSRDLTALVQQPDPRVFSRLPAVRRKLGRYDRTALDNLAASAPAPLPVPAAARELHARLVQPIVDAGREERALLEEVWARPDDDGPRAVYSDWLLERDHPRGEFIALQLASELDDRRRARVLRMMDRFFDDWAGGIASVVDRGTYERGFLGAVRLHADPVRLAATIGRPEWGTVRRIDYHAGDSATFVALVAHKAARGLRELGWLVDEPFYALAACGTPLPIERLGFASKGKVVDASAIAPAAAGAAFPDVRAFECTGLVVNGWLPGSPFAARLEELAVRCTRNESVTWARAFAEEKFPRVSWLRLSLRGDGVLDVRDHVLHTTGVGGAVIAWFLDALPARTFEGVQILDDKPRWKQEIAAAASRHGGVLD